MALMQQMRAAGRIGVSGLRERAAMSLSTIVGVALVVLVLMGFLAMADGFRRVADGTGEPDIALILSRGARGEQGSNIPLAAYRALESGALIKRQNGHPLIAAEAYQAVGATKADGTFAGLTLRGISVNSPALRSGWRLAEGRMFSPGSAEIVIGRSVAENFRGFALGHQVRLGGIAWTVTGIFADPGTVWESEIWADLPVVQSQFNQGSAVQSLRARLRSPADLPAFDKLLGDDPRLHLTARSEAEYFRAQAQGTVKLIRGLGWPLGALMAFGALAGCLNTMYSSVATRAREIATLRAIGFGPGFTFITTMSEAVLLAAVGGGVGILAGVLILNNISTSTVGGNMTQTVFALNIAPLLAAQAFLLALVVGVIGGLFPAWRAARQPILSGLAEA